ncbi:polyadenylate-binding protein 2-like [Dendronephthya gigantea]|uniref:polyadenylate-binding protein 2-like n=1 Tax=Dendronephthya gigantea TaxID=151771 RepID=UPI00106DA708|nr:polyadenylate-binding protein 2-like [Dendronephthya gigantea]XP_028392411.1 polyadenylate-binding protein 2-like [Dendronephthya gigantea]XP_028417911.1 polyadenylate-binding protein 2-like [Dendronephthya gigantea]
MADEDSNSRSRENSISESPGLDGEFSWPKSLERLDSSSNDGVLGLETSLDPSLDVLDVSGDHGNDVDDPELEAIKARVKEMEEEAEKLKDMQKEIEGSLNLSASPTTAALPTLEEKQEVDARSVYVGNVDYSATAEELEQHFHGCGSVNRVTILCDKYTGHPKGFAYVEFADKESVNNSTALTDSLFKGRQIKVVPKRTNQPGISSTDRGFSRGRGRGRSRGFHSPGYYPGYRPRIRGRGMYRPRRRGWYPY